MAKKTPADNVTTKRAATETQGLPEGGSWLTPHLVVASAEAALEFYERAFGFARVMVLPGPDGKIGHAGMTYQGRSIVMFGPEGAWDSTIRTPAHSGIDMPCSFYVYCADVDALARQAGAAGATVTRPPETMFWGDRIADIRDPDGYHWTFATKVGEFDPSKMPRG